MLRHAYLIIAHGNWDQLALLLRLLDAPNNTIYIHIDRKAEYVPRKKLERAAALSQVYIYQQYKVYWGSYELVQTELFLFEKAYRQGYDYYHLLSGADLPIKSLSYIEEFFEKNKGYEFVHYDTDERLIRDREIGRRTRLYHFLQNYRRRYRTKALNSCFTFGERILLAAQLAARVDRTKKYPGFQIRYGSQWVSITDELVSYILGKKELIRSVFMYTNCADELFIQSLVYNSRFRDRLYDRDYDDDVRGNMRLIDMKARGKNGNPYTWRDSDWEEIRDSECLFARKFDWNTDQEIIERIRRYVSE